jgi:hypothetical protein
MNRHGNPLGGLFRDFKELEFFPVNCRREKIEIDTCRPLLLKVGKEENACVFYTGISEKVLTRGISPLSNRSGPVSYADKLS